MGLCVSSFSISVCVLLEYVNFILSSILRDELLAIVKD